MAFGEEVRRRLGWHPADDPAELWQRSDPAPTLPWAVPWDDGAHSEGAALGVSIARGTARLRQVVEERGWPGRTLVGEDGADAAWMLAMHADNDPDLQHRCVALLEAATRAGEADPRHCATLIDRVGIGRDGVQHYGTLVLPEAGSWRPLVPIVDAGQVDSRRGALGIPSIANDLAAGPGQLPYRHLRRSPTFGWPRP